MNRNEQISIITKHENDIQKLTSPLSSYSEDLIGMQLSSGLFEAQSIAIDLHGIVITERKVKNMYLSSGSLPEVIILCFPIDKTWLYINGVKIYSNSFYISKGVSECTSIFMEKCHYIMLTIEYKTITKYLKKHQFNELIKVIDELNINQDYIQNHLIQNFIYNIFNYLHWHDNNKATKNKNSQNFCWMIINFLYNSICRQKNIINHYNSSHARIVQRSIKYTIDRKSTFTIQELSSNVFASKRAIQYAFAKILNISPYQFIKAISYNQIRYELQIANQSSATISAILSNHNISNLSRYKCEYYNFFNITTQDSINAKKSNQNHQDNS